MPRDTFLFGSEQQARVFTFVNERFQRTGNCTEAPEVADYLNVQPYTATRLLRVLERERKLLERRWRGCYQPCMPLSDRIKMYLGLVAANDAYTERFKRDWESR